MTDYFGCNTITTNLLGATIYLHGVTTYFFAANINFNGSKNSCSNKYFFI